MLNQYDSRWKNEKLGSSSSTIGGYGCNLTCICEGLNRHGYSYTPTTLNNLFKSNGSYTSGNLISPATIAAKNPTIFKSGSNEAWSDSKVINYLKQDDVILIGEVDARGIGGVGQHFVLILGVVTNAKGAVTNTKIGDPWGGIENYVTVRYAKYDCIKSLRVYKVYNKKTSTGTSTSSGDAGRNTGSEASMDKIYEFLDCDNYETAERKLIDHLGINGKKCGWGDASGKDTGGYLGSERREKAQLQTSVASLENTVEMRDGEIKTLKSEKAKLENASAEKDVKIADLKKKYDSAQATIEDLEVGMDTYKDEVKTLKANLDLAQAQVENYKKLASENSGELTDKIASIETENKKLTQENENLRQALTIARFENAQNESKPLWQLIVERLKELFS